MEYQGTINGEGQTVRDCFEEQEAFFLFKDCHVPNG